MQTLRDISPYLAVAAVAAVLAENDSLATTQASHAAPEGGGDDGVVAKLSFSASTASKTSSRTRRPSRRKSTV